MTEKANRVRDVKGIAVIMKVKSGKRDMLLAMLKTCERLVYPSDIRGENNCPADHRDDARTW